MKIVALFLACVALFNFAKVAAMNNDGRAGHNRRGPLQPGRTTLSNTRLDMAAWTNHDHNHGTGIQRPVLGHPSCKQEEILITKVVNGNLAKWHALVGELVPDANITSCNGPFGYAIVEFNDSELLYACLHPPRHTRPENRELTGGVPEFFAYIVRNGMVPPSLVGVLTTGDARITLISFHEKYPPTHVHRLGHVSYIRSDPISPIHVGGDIYKM